MRKLEANMKSRGYSCADPFSSKPASKPLLNRENERFRSLPHRVSVLAQAGGLYQMGDVQARSCMLGRCSSEQQAASRSGIVAGSSQRTPAALHVY